MIIHTLNDRTVGILDLPLDTATPVSAFLSLQEAGAVCLLESVEKGETLGRYSFIGLEPEESIVLENDELRINGQSIPWREEELLAILRRCLSERLTIPGGDAAFCGGWFGYFGYETVRFMEEMRFRCKEKSTFPEIFLYKISKLVIFDHLHHTVRIVVSRPHAAAAGIRAEIDSVLALLQRGDARSMTAPGRVDGLEGSLTEAEFLQAVGCTQEHIRAGDIFQAVVSIRFRGRTATDPFTLYRHLRILNPSPYMFYFHFGDFQLIGSSPELHAKMEDGRVAMRPIAGTRRRGRGAEEDRAMEEELLNDEKERAEHIMLIDLARNDLGRICRPGTVRVRERMVIERYSHVMHIVSHIDGELAPEKDGLDVLQATFPAGTVSGAPKIRAMEIIDALEPVQRGPYGGAVGYFSFSGTMDFCIGIRMMLYRGGEFFLQAGAGIVEGSRPELEYKEIRNKIAGLQQALHGPFKETNP